MVHHYGVPGVGGSATTNALSTRLEAGGGSVASDSCLLDDELEAEMRVMLRRPQPQGPSGKKGLGMARPQSEAYLLDRVAKGTSTASAGKRKSKRYSAFGVSHYFVTDTSLHCTLGI